MVETNELFNMTKLEDRMKGFYEIRDRRFLSRKIPVIIRLDGKAFGTYTKNLNKPFDEGFIEDMQSTTKYLCENIQGCKFGYVPAGMNLTQFLFSHIYLIKNETGYVSNDSIVDLSKLDDLIVEWKAQYNILNNTK